jgi:enoyl-CoA hydratase
VSRGVRLDIEGPVATLTNARPERHNAFDDEMDGELFQALDEIGARDDLRVVIWRGDGPSFSSGRDVDAIKRPQLDLTPFQLAQRISDGGRRILELPVPMIVALHGWTMGVSFQRALLADIRIAAEGTRFRLPETAYGYIPDSGGVARLHQMCGHGVVSDLVLTGRDMEVDEAYAHGIVSRVVDPTELDAVTRRMADAIVAAPTITVKAARQVIAHLATPAVAASMAEETLAQTVISASQDHAELRRARRDGRPPTYQGT